MKNLSEIFFNKNSIKSYSPLFFVMMFLVYPPPFFLSNVEFGLRNILRIGIFVVIFITYTIVFYYKKKTSILFIISLFFIIYLLLITLLKKGNVFETFGIAVFSMSEFMLYELFIDSKYKEVFIKSCYIYYLFTIIVSLLLYCFYYISVVYVNRNHYVQYIFPLIILEYYIYVYYNNTIFDRIRYLSISLVLLFSVILGSTTGIFVIVLLYIYIYIYIIVKKKYNYILDAFNSWKVQFVAICLFFVVCVWFGDLNQIANIISMIFGKPRGFSYRTNLVIFARKTILKNFLFGVGITNLQKEGFLDFAGNVHNIFLQYLAYGGLVAFILLICNIICVYKSIDKNCNANVKYVWFMIFSMFLLRGMMEEVPLYHYYITVALIYYLNIQCNDYIDLNKILLFIN